MEAGAPMRTICGVNKPPQPPQTDWNRAADWYDSLVGDTGSEYHKHVILPGVMKLIAPNAGAKVLDVACGQGVLCRMLAEKGAAATGVDAAVELIKAARERGPAGIKYFVGDARDLRFLPENHYDAAACVLAIQNIHPIAPLCSSVSKVLKPMGRFVVVMMHPCFRGHGESSWGWDDTKKVQYRRVDRYLLPRKTPIVTHPGSNPDEYTWSFHKPLEAYLKALRSAGLLVDAMEEWASHKHSDSGPRAPAENISRKEIPMFCALRGVKISGLVTESV